MVDSVDPDLNIRLNLSISREMDPKTNEYQDRWISKPMNQDKEEDEMMTTQTNSALFLEEEKETLSLFKREGDAKTIEEDAKTREGDAKTREEDAKTRREDAKTLRHYLTIN